MIFFFRPRFFSKLFLSDFSPQRTYLPRTHFVIFCISSREPRRKTMTTIEVPSGFALVLGVWGIGCGLILNIVVRYGRAHRRDLRRHLATASPFDTFTTLSPAAA